VTRARETQLSDRDRRGPIVRTAAALLSVQGMTWLSSLVSLLIVPRYLGADRLGIFAVAGTLATIATLVAGWGTGNQIVKAVAREPARAASVVLHAIALRLAIWSVFALLTAVALVTVVHDGTSRAVVVLMLGSAALGLIGNAAGAGLRGNQTIGRLAIIGAFIGVASQGATIFVLVSGGGLIALGLLGMGFAVVSTSLAVVLFWRKLGRRVAWSRPVLVSIASGGFAFLAWEVAMQTYGTIDYILLAALTDAKTVGDYAFALRLAGIPIFAATIVTSSIYPALAAASLTDRPFFKRLLTEGTHVVIAVSLPMAAGLIVLAPQLARLIGGGSQFDSSVPLLIILSLQIPLVAVDTVLGTGLYALDRQKRLALVGWCAAVLNPLFNLAAIPLTVHWFGNGAIGAAVMTAVTECFVGAWIWSMLGSSLGHARIVGTAARSLTGCAVMAVAVLVAEPHVGTILSIPLGAGVYGVSALALGLFSVADVRQVRRAFTSREPELVQA